MPKYVTVNVETIAAALAASKLDSAAEVPSLSKTLNPTTTLNPHT